MIENTQGFGQIWKTYLIASTGWKGELTGNFDTTDQTPFQAADQPDMAGGVYGPVYVCLYPQSGVTSHYYYGAIWPNLSITADLKSTVRFSLSFTGNDRLYVF